MDPMGYVISSHHTNSCCFGCFHFDPCWWFWHLGTPSPLVSPLQWTTPPHLPWHSTGIRRRSHRHGISSPVSTCCSPNNWDHALQIYPFGQSNMAGKMPYKWIDGNFFQLEYQRVQGKHWNPVVNHHYPFLALAIWWIDIYIYTYNLFFLLLKLPQIKKGLGVALPFIFGGAQLDS